MSDWRYYKEQVEEFKRRRRVLIHNTNFFNIKEKSNKVTWKDIYDDLVNQKRNYYKLMKNLEEYEEEEAEATRAKANEIKKDLEEHHEAIRREETRQKKAKHEN